MRQIIVAVVLLLSVCALSGAGYDTNDIHRSNYPIVAAEYYIDIDPGYGNATPISIVSGSNISFNIGVNTETLSMGTHRIYIRCQDANGDWGIPQSKMFVVQEKTQADPTPAITQ
ncbi:MAG: hypothetical protein CVU50_06480, partial [Candidatus Cloacimonetes bacterium HGW-Cloacimonetes-3]